MRVEMQMLIMLRNMENNQELMELCPKASFSKIEEKHKSTSP